MSAHVVFCKELARIFTELGGVIVRKGGCVRHTLLFFKHIDIGYFTTFSIRTAPLA